jgi:hypothetical protein
MGYGSQRDNGAMQVRTPTSALLLLGALTFSSAQTVTDIVPPNPTRSGLVRLYGSNFGDESQNRLFLAQVTGSRDSSRTTLPVHIARWTSSFIEFYVPEEAALQSAGLYMGVPGGKVFMGMLDIQGRSPVGGRFAWRFKAADQYIVTRPALAPDGTIYAIGNFGHLYALRPDGGLKWIWSKGAEGTVDIGPDGTVYCAGGGGIQAFTPNGVRKWVFPLESTILAGPGVGPDGNIYAADNSRWNLNPTGAVVISPAGQEIWRGGKFFMRGGPHQIEVQFDGTHAYIWSDGDTISGAVGGLHGINLGGGFDWNNGNIVGFQPSSYETGGVVAHGTSTTQRMNTNGSLAWSFDLWSIGGSQPHGDLVSSPDGGAYFFTKNTKLNAINPNGSLRYSSLVGGIVGNLVRSPDATKLYLQHATNFGQPFRVEAYNAANGTFLWASDGLPFENGTFISIYERIKIAPNGTMAYFGTAGPYTATGVAHCYVYAMNAQ